MGSRVRRLGCWWGCRRGSFVWEVWRGGQRLFGFEFEFEFEFDFDFDFDFDLGFG